jgi:hypothetical protein
MPAERRHDPYRQKNIRFHVLCQLAQEKKITLQLASFLYL